MRLIQKLEQWESPKEPTLLVYQWYLPHRGAPKHNLTIGILGKFVFNLHPKQ